MWGGYDRSSLYAALGAAASKVKETAGSAAEVRTFAWRGPEQAPRWMQAPHETTPAVTSARAQAASALAQQNAPVATVRGAPLRVVTVRLSRVENTAGLPLDDASGPPAPRAMPRQGMLTEYISGARVALEPVLTQTTEVARRGVHAVTEAAQVRARTRAAALALARSHRPAPAARLL